MFHYVIIYIYNISWVREENHPTKANKLCTYMCVFVYYIYVHVYVIYIYDICIHVFIVYVGICMYILQRIAHVFGKM